MARHRLFDTALWLATATSLILSFFVYSHPVPHWLLDAQYFLIGCWLTRYVDDFTVWRRKRRGR